MNLDEFFAAAKRQGIGVLVINTLHTGDVINAENVAGGDINASRNLTVPREALAAPRHQGHSVTVAPLDPWVGGYYAGARKAADDEYAAKIADGTLWK